MQVQQMKIADLKSAKYNPKSRVERSKLGKLIQSIEKIGLIYPIAISKDHQIIDGHRRVAACKALQWEEVPVLIVAGDADEIYGNVNFSTRRLTGNEKLRIWLQQPNAIDTREHAIYKRAEDQLGRGLLNRIAKTGGSITTYRWCLEVASYVEDKRPEFIRKAAHWIIKYRSARLVRSLMALKQQPGVIVKAINSNKPITANFTVMKQHP